MDGSPEISAAESVVYASANRLCQALDSVAHELIGVVERKTIIERGLRAIMDATDCQLAVLWLAGSATPDNIIGWPVPPEEILTKMLQEMPAPQWDQKKKVTYRIFSYRDANSPYSALLNTHGIAYLCEVSLHNDGLTLGTLALIRTKRSLFTVQDNAVIVQLSSMFSLALARSVTDPATAISSEERQRMWAELNHRVRNNMAIICALLEMEMMQASAGEHDRLIITLARIRSLTLVYNLVLQDKDGCIEISELSSGIISSISSLFQKNITRRLMQADSEVLINQSRSIYLSLVLTELVVHIFQCIADCPHPCQPAIKMKQENGLVCIELSNSNESPCAHKQMSPLSREILIGLVEFSLQGSIIFGGPAECQITTWFPAEDQEKGS